MWESRSKRLKTPSAYAANPAPPPNPDGLTPPPSRGRPNVIIVLIPLLVVLITFLFWYATWFGRRLSDAEMSEYLSDTSVPHKTQHALAVLAGEIQRGDPSARRWYPDLLKLTASPEPELRQMSAWVMGQDNQNPEFHRALRSLLGDPAVMVRGNAALALVRYGDSSGEPELVRLLRPYELPAPASGKLSVKVKPGDDLNPGSLLAKITTGSGTLDVRSPLSGRLDKLVVPDGATVAAGQTLAVLAPGADQVWEALRALYLVGRPADLSEVERYATGAPGMPQRVRVQAQLAEQAIRTRSRKAGSQPAL
jgi:hypothetical protein